MDPINSLRFQENQVMEADRPSNVPGAVKSEKGEKIHKKVPETGTDQGTIVRDSVKTREKMERIAEALDNYVKSIQHDLDIKVDEETGRFLVKVISHESGEVIREIPPEELLKLAAKMEEMAGVLFNKSV